MFDRKLRERVERLELDTLTSCIDESFNTSNLVPLKEIVHAILEYLEVAPYKFTAKTCILKKGGVLIDHISGITCCFICDTPLVMGKSRKLWTAKGKYQHTCTGCVTREQDAAMVKIWEIK